MPLGVQTDLIFWFMTTSKYFAEFPRQEAKGIFGNHLILFSNLLPEEFHLQLQSVGYATDVEVNWMLEVRLADVTVSNALGTPSKL